MNKRFAAIDTGSIAYCEMGNGEQTLLFIHGAFINKTYWYEQLTFFSKHYRVFAIDLPGHGESTSHSNDWSMERISHDVVQFIKTLNLNDIVLIGHSFGADVMLEVEVCEPSRISGLVAVDHLKDVDNEIPQNEIDNLIAALNADFRTTCEHHTRQALVNEDTSKAITNKLLSDLLTMPPASGIPILKGSFAYASRERSLLHDLTRKLYLIQVDYLPTNEASLQNYVNKNYELSVLSGTCHYPMLEDPNQFNLALNEVLLKLSKKPFN